MAGPRLLEGVDSRQIAQGQADVVEPFQEPVFSERVDLESG